MFQVPGNNRRWALRNWANARPSTSRITARPPGRPAAAHGYATGNIADADFGRILEMFTGDPVVWVGGHRNDVTQLTPLIQAVPPIRGVAGRPRRRPRRRCADRGCDHDKCRRLVRALGITQVIARCGVEHGSGPGKIRWPVERTFAWPKGFRRLRVRTERRADVQWAILSLACSVSCLRTLIPNGVLQARRQGMRVVSAHNIDAFQWTCPESDC